MYQHHWASLVAFMDKIMGITLHPPLSPTYLALFIAYLYKNNLKYSTIMTYISAISYYHKLLNLPDPHDAFMIIKLLQGLKHTSSALPPLLPISRPILHKLIDHLPLITRDPYDQALYTALFLMMYSACLRIGEIAVSNHSDNILYLRNLQLVKIGSKAVAFTLMFNSYKHSNGTTANLRINALPLSYYCPVTKLVEYLKLRGLNPGPIFITKAGRPLTRTQVASTLKTCSTIANLQTDSLNTHSFRAGRTSDLAQSHSPSVIQHIGRWKSDAYQRYIHPNTIILPN